MKDYIITLTVEVENKTEMDASEFVWRLETELKELGLINLRVLKVEEI